MNDIAIELKGIDKKFGLVHANKNINMKVRKGTIHGIIGENGAGKSTLMSILYGFYQADNGDIFVDGKKTVIKDPNAAISVGIGMVHQHFMLVENFSVLENIMLGAEESQVLNAGITKARRELKQLEEEYELEVDPDAIIEELPVGIQQRVEILKALYRGAEILILDEPTGVLTPAEADHLFRILKQLKSEGKTILLITHKLREIMAVTDKSPSCGAARWWPPAPPPRLRSRSWPSSWSAARASAGRKGARIARRRHALGREPDGARQPRRRHGQECFLRRAGRRDRRHCRCCRQRPVGAAQAISGIRRAVTGKVMLQGEPIHVTGTADPAELRHRGLAHVPEDRQHMGLVLKFDESENSILGYHDDPKYLNGMFLNIDAIRKDAGRQDREIRYPPAQSRLKTANFSGGNQQKLCWRAKWSAIRRFLSSVSRPAAWMSAPSNSFTSASSRCAMPARPCCWSRSNSTRSDRCRTGCWSCLTAALSASARPMPAKANSGC
jgi:ABC-type branched-subunit amino acid transport system ATPase component